MSRYKPAGAITHGVKKSEKMPEVLSRESRGRTLREKGVREAHERVNEEGKTKTATG